MPIDLIYTKTDKWILSKVTANYKTWQEKFYFYTTHLNFTDVENLVLFLKDGFKLSDKNRTDIFNDVTNSNKDFFELKVLNNTITITELQLQLLQSKETLIDWEDWSFIFRKTNNNDYYLWVFLGGIANQVREIKLSATQIKEWEEIGNTYSKELALELKQKNSETYNNAINNNRRVL